MREQGYTKWKDPRTPISVTQVGKFTVTIYNQALYDASLREYPDDTIPHNQQIKKPIRTPFEKKKTASRYNWITKLDTPLAITIRQKEKAS